MATAGDRVVTVFGGTGFLGRCIVRHLRLHGFCVRVASRHPDRGHVLVGPGSCCRLMLLVQARKPLPPAGRAHAPFKIQSNPFGYSSTVVEFRDCNGVACRLRSHLRVTEFAEGEDHVGNPRDDRERALRRHCALRCRRADGGLTQAVRALSM
jgi:NAD(P)-dependent dehydrogenase (short-subunit alcohol dehydrogenase family)